jgi:serine phosphatase RsbU (regulator of sigma subunit)
VPSSVRGLFAWFKHNPFIASEVDLPKGRFGAMRSPLAELMDLYAVDVIMPLVDRDRLLAVIGLALDRKPSILERELLRVFRLEATAACANVRLHHQAAHLVSMAKEVDLASSIELAMVPDTMNGQAGHFHWAGHFAAAGQAGSDFWGIYPLEQGRMMLVMGDAVGTDVAGTMVSAVVKSCCDEIFERRPKELDPARLLTMLNDSLFRPNRPALTSCFAALFDPVRQTVFYSNAGHIPPYRVRPEGDGLALGVLRGTGPLLGDVSHPGFEVHSIPLQPGDTFLLLTNGLLAPRDASGSEFGFRRLQHLLAQQDSADPEHLRACVLEALEAHSVSRRLFDDQALVIVGCD